MFEKYADKLSLQMYTVHTEAYSDLEGTFGKVYDMGYRAIEYYGEQALFDKETVKRMPERTGLKMASWHTEWRDLQEETYDKTVDYLEEVGCPLVVVPCLGGEWNIAHNKVQECRELWFRYIDWLNDLSEKLKKRGMRAGYHNHNHEFTLKYDGKFVFDILFENLSSDIVMEFDTGRALAAGADCVDVIRRYADRDILMHFKPFGTRDRYETVLGSEDDQNDVPAMLQAYPKEFLWVMVESENQVNPQLENARLNAEYLKKVFSA
jgi:sugar phosphate isomerase/epimerase